MENNAFMLYSPNLDSGLPYGLVKVLIRELQLIALAITNVIYILIFRSLYNETTVKPELVHEVEMGPFKHVGPYCKSLLFIFIFFKTVDDGLDLRKAAFEWYESALAPHLIFILYFKYVHSLGAVP